MKSAQAVFSEAHPVYAATSRLDELRAREYRRLDENGHVYLDYTGGSLAAECQLREHTAMLERHVFGNPHSDNPTSAASTELVERARAAVLAFFNAAPDEYVVIWTANATAACRLVGEAYPWRPGGRYLLTLDNHNSVNGIREFAKARGAAVTYLPITPQLRIDAEAMALQLEAGSGNLLAYPAQSNFSGVQHDLSWIPTAHARGWDVLLDAAAYVPTNRLDLGRWHPDFVPISFYKMFGWPTGVGCLLARRAAVAKLRRPWFAGGTVRVASAQGGWHVSAGVPEAFEDGTLDYLAIPAVEIGLRYIGGIGTETIKARVRCLLDWLLTSLLALRHDTGAPLVRLYGPHDCHRRGATVACNFLDSAGQVVDRRVVEHEAKAWGISLRTGCFCNPGAGAVALGVHEGLFSEEALLGANEAGLSIEERLDILGLLHLGAVRVSLGVASNFADVARFLQFAMTFLNRHPHPTGQAW
ncbi:MAG: aminotransferase class V-fold PLP-dependent enzyme [Egibacteraceae bacterium]